MSWLSYIWAAIKAIFSGYVGAKQQVGVDQGRAEAERDMSVASAKTESRVAQAEVDAPHSITEAERRAEDGTL